MVVSTQELATEGNRKEHDTAFQPTTSSGIEAAATTAAAKGVRPEVTATENANFTTKSNLGETKGRRTGTSEAPISATPTTIRSGLAAAAAVEGTPQGRGDDRSIEPPSAPEIATTRRDPNDIYTHHEEHDDSWSDSQARPGAMAIDGPHLPSSSTRQAQVSIEEEEEDNSNSSRTRGNNESEDENNEEPVVTTAKVVDEEAERKRAIATATDEELRDRIAASNSNRSEIVVATADVSSPRKRYVIYTTGVVTVVTLVILLILFQVGPRSNSKPRNTFFCGNAIELGLGKMRFDSIFFNIDDGSLQTSNDDDNVFLSPLLEKCPNFVPSNNTEVDKVDASFESFPFVNGIWYTVTGLGLPLSISTCLRANFDTKIAIFRGDNCGQLECVAYNDDTSEALGAAGVCGPNDSEVTWSTQFQEKFYVLVGGIPMQNDTQGLEDSTSALTTRTIEGEFAFSVRETVENDVCDTAIGPVPIDGSLIEGSTTTATISHSFIVENDEEQMMVPVGRGVWYKVIGTGGPLVASTCHPRTTFDTILSVYASPISDSCDENDLILLESNDDSFCGRQSSLRWSTERLEEYLIYVQGHGNLAGDFVLSVSYIIANDVCDMALQISTPSIVPGTTENSTVDTIAPTCVHAPQASNGPGVWYVVEGTGHRFIASTCESTLEANNSNSVLRGQLAVYRGYSCGELACERVTVDRIFPTLCGSASVSWQTQKYESYYILVHDITSTMNISSIKSFDLELNVEVGLTNFDDCYNELKMSDQDQDLHLGFEEYEQFVHKLVSNHESAYRCFEWSNALWTKTTATFNRIVAENSMPNTCSCSVGGNETLFSANCCPVGERAKIPIAGDSVDQQLLIRKTCWWTHQHIISICGLPRLDEELDHASDESSASTDPVDSAAFQLSGGLWVVLSWIVVCTLCLVSL